MSRAQNALKRKLQAIDRAVQAEITDMLDHTGRALAEMHREVVRSWRHRPGFRVLSKRSGNTFTIQIVPTGRHAKIWGYVDKGTKPHIIRAKNAPFLAFQTGYDARTQPVAQWGVGSGRASGPWVRKKSVRHPGFPGRKFSETFLDEVNPPLETRTRDAVMRGLTKAT
jgi:hypothetical protein